LGASAISDEGVDESQPQFKVEIKNDVIHEEEEEADAALSKVANTLRAVGVSFPFDLHNCYLTI
jgi:hypothetical protein